MEIHIILSPYKISYTEKPTAEKTAGFAMKNFALPYIMYAS
jgi:hypothetical protein